MRKTYVNVVRQSVGAYLVIDRYLGEEITLRGSTSATSALKRYLGSCSTDHPFVDAPIESMGIDYAMTV